MNHQPSFLKLLATVPFIFISLNASSQCSALSIDTAYVQETPDRIEGYVHNTGNMYIIYPLIQTSVEPNPYLEIDTASTVPSYLDSAGGSNNGVTHFFHEVHYSMPLSQIPANTVLLGNVHIEDPVDSTVFCDLMLSLVINPADSADTLLNTFQFGDFGKISIHPNPIRDGRAYLSSAHPWTGSRSVRLVTPTGSVIFEQPLQRSNRHLLNFPALPEGVYFLMVRSGERTLAIEKIAVFE